MDQSVGRAATGPVTPTLAAVRRAPGSPRPAGIPLAGLAVVLLAVVVLGGTGYGYARFQDDIDAATASPTADRTDHSAWEDEDPTPDADDPEPSADATSATADPVQPAEPTVTFDPVVPTEGRTQPVVLLVGDGYAAGRGASSVGTAYPSLLARDLDWDIRLATATGAGYLSASPTLLDLFTSSPVDLDPDLVIVQGAYGSNSSNDEAKAAIATLDAAIRERYPDVPVAVVTPFATEITGQIETRERTIARAWRDDPAVLVLRPQLEGWASVDTGDPGHALIADSMTTDFAATGLLG